jgi:hypothetical protein
MSVLVISEIPGGTSDQDEVMVQALGLTNDPPQGVRTRLAGPMDGGWRIVSLWDSRDLFQSFVEDRLKPALDAAGRPLPQFTFWNIETAWSS